MAKMRTVLLAVTLLLILALGCKEESPVPTTSTLFESPESPINPTTALQPSPTPLLPSPTPLPSPTAELALPEPSSAEVGVIGGVLHPTMELSVPLAGMTLYLARVIQSESGAPLVASLNEARAPKATVEEDGSFAFTDVPAGTYGLVIKTPIVTVMLEDTDGGDFLITLQAGQVINLREIYTDLSFR